MSLVVHPPAAEAQSRLTAMRLVSMSLRQMEDWRSVSNDHDSIMIMMAVALINTERFTGEKLVAQNVASLKKAVPAEMLRGCNVSSVALATGLNRETARRKIAWLVELKLLAKGPKGHVYLHPEMGIREHIVELLRSQLDLFVRTANDLLRDGTLKYVDDRAGRARGD